MHKHCWSIRRGGKVIEHATDIYIKDAWFVVRESGRQKVIETGHKNVHAFVCSYNVETLVEGMGDTLDNFNSTVSYNPHKSKTFVDASGTPVLEARHVVMTRTLASENKIRPVVRISK